MPICLVYIAILQGYKRGYSWVRCKHCLCLDCCNMNEPQRILVNTNFPKLRPLLAVERSNDNHHWFCEKACDMAIGHRHYAHSPLKKSRGGGFHTGNRPHRLFGVSSKNGYITQISEPGEPGSDTLLWWKIRDSNPRPLRCERSALTS